MQKFIRLISATAEAVATGVKTATRFVLAAGMVAGEFAMEYATVAIGTGITAAATVAMVYGDVTEIGRAALVGGVDGVSLALAMAVSRLKANPGLIQSVVFDSVHDLKHASAAATLVAVMKAVGEMVIG